MMLGTLQLTLNSLRMWGAALLLYTPREVNFRMVRLAMSIAVYVDCSQCEGRSFKFTNASSFRQAMDVGCCTALASCPYIVCID
jgi:hypothetical protein